MVKDQPRSLAWYRDLLGLEVLFDAPFTDPEARVNNFSVPANLATTLVRRAAVVQPVLPGEAGRIEVMQFEGFTGRDLSAHASLPNLGIISVRYPVRDLEGYLAMLEAASIVPEMEASGITIEGLRGSGAAVHIAAVRDPDGNLTEFYHAR
jgi:catechol 2,3-dioxygenase-like lactoylglutathione lyase family enzyme